MTNNDRGLALHKKRFGQFFSGEKVAQLLCSLLPEGTLCETIVDPMAGIGDMLKVATNNYDSTRVLGVEIDKKVAEECAIRVPSATIINADAFCSDELITDNGWDLVITNPPYVRYQLQGSDDEGIMPTGADIRSNLIQQIGKIKYIDERERELFNNISINYSGLSDMAVPAWILCAALVKKGGYLAIVVPETWLNRDYASPIHYLISKLFQIEIIAKDTSASWFPDALVKTSLVVAKRVGVSNLQKQKRKTQIIDMDEKGIAIRTACNNTDTLFPYMFKGKDAHKWILDEDRALLEEETGLPHELTKLFEFENTAGFLTLSDMGINCGQGLRTGANDFFYVTILQEEGAKYLVRSNDWDSGGRNYHFPKNNLILALKKRGEIQGLVVRRADLNTGVLSLKNKAEGELEKYTNAGEDYKDEKGKSFQDYSAVKPNKKIVDGVIVRHWYMLPNFTNRHLPSLCMTRLSVGVPECLYVEQNEDENLAVDANMVTFWSSDGSNDKAVFAILNSTWCKLYLELICTVMGGGALKVETSHLKKLRIPVMSQKQLNKLKSIGEELIAIGFMKDEIQDKIDAIVFSSFEDDMIISDARKLLAQKIKERSKKNG